MRRLVSAAVPFLAALVALPCVRGQNPVWHRARGLDGRDKHAMAYDSARQRLVLFGGSASHAAFPAERGDTWEWDGSQWLQQEPQASPPSRVAHAMAYDANRRRVVLFGGVAGQATLNDTWEWDGATWHLRQPATAVPPPRADAAMVYDAARQRIVVFGGQDGGGALRDTWEWDGTAWSQRSFTGGPPPRSNHAMAYDVVRRRVVLYGGADGLQRFGDLWEWDGTAWLQRQPAPGPSPKPLWCHAMTYDAARGEVVLFGGLENQTYQAVTWTWDGTRWQQRQPPSAPPPYALHALAYDERAQRVVLFGGVGGHEHRSDTWSWDGATWTRLDAGTMTARAWAAIVHDASRDQLLLFGGEAPLTTRKFDETWIWDGTGTQWRRLQPPTVPPARSEVAMAFDVLRQNVVLFGGTDGSAARADTWTWNGTNWLPGPSGPPARSAHAMAYDFVRHEVVLFGGRVPPPAGPSLRGDTWVWNGSSWSLRATTGPSPRSHHAMAFDVVRGRVVLFGGRGPYPTIHGDTWEWDGANWSPIATAVAPRQRAGHVMTADLARQKVILFGGVDDQTQAQFADTWEWDGSAWTQLPASPSPGHGDGQAITYDHARRRVVLYGGGGLRETWFLGAFAPAAASTQGVGCAGTLGTPILSSNLPWIGNPALALDLLQARPSAPCALGVAAAAGNLPLGGGCSLYLQQPLVPLPLATNAAGFASLVFAVPLDPTLRGATLYAQGFVIDPQGSAFGLAVTAARALSFGD